jgi:uncharacterized protein YcaQ
VLDSISKAEARRVVLAAQGFDRPRPATVAREDVSDVVRRLGLLQLDSVNVFCRSHYLPVFSRLGPYNRAELDSMAGHAADRDSRELFEYWGHEASLMPDRIYSLLEWRTHRADLEAWKFVVNFAREHPEYIEQILAIVTERGPVRGNATGEVRDQARQGEMWNWHNGKLALEYLFYAGKVAVSQRINFERLYDLPERVLPLTALEPVLAEEDAQRELIRVAAAALGVATEPDLGDYFRLTRGDSKQRVGELVDAGELHPVTVEGWSTTAYVWPAAAKQQPANARALLSPFDSLIWTRARTQRVFDFDYHLEIYTPAAKRVYGYYVLPFLLGDELVARVDLKTDRKARRLLVQGAFAEAEPELVADELAQELTDISYWLDLEGIEVLPRGDLAQSLTRSLTRLAQS